MGRALGTHRLIAHPGHPPARVAAVHADLRAGEHGLRIEYRVAPADTPLLPAERAPQRADDLWRTTCFELFVRPTGEARYFEYNFSPSREWAAYEFGAYRSGGRDLPMRAPEISVRREGFSLAVEGLPALPEGPLRIGLSAVIEEESGEKSYWALAHPPGRPDFHHEDCFALELAAPLSP